MPPHARHNRCRPTALAVTAIGLVLLLGHVPVLAVEPSAALRRQVTQHVSELSSTLRSERVRAEQALLGLGPQVLELLPSPEETPDQATRIAVRQLRVKLERIAAEESVQPSRVSLKGRLSIADIAVQIQEQTGNAVSVTRLPDALRGRSVDVDFADTPFWETLTVVCASADLSWQTVAETGTVELIEPAADQVPRLFAAGSGAFLVSVVPLSTQRATLRASLQLEAEPRLWPLFVRIADADFSAGKEPALTLFNPLAVTELPMTGRSPAQFSVLFRAPEVPVNSVSLRGRVSVHVAAAPAEVRFSDLAANRAVYLRHGGVSVTLKQTKISKRSDQTRDAVIRLSVAYDSGGPEFESHRTWIYHNEARLETPGGVHSPVESSFDATRQKNGGIDVEYRFSELSAADLQACELVYVAPTLLIDVPVEFQFDQCPVMNDEQK